MPRKPPRGTTNRQTSASGTANIAIGGDASGNVIITGENNTVILTVFQQNTALEPERLEPSSPIDQTSNPYRGLSAFQEADSEMFFGRDAPIRDLHAQFSKNYREPGCIRLLPVLGPSGCGKSSLVRAGLLPALVRTPVAGTSRLRVAVLTPGASPIEELAGSLARIVSDDPLPIRKAREIAQELRITDRGRFKGLCRIVDLGRGSGDHVIIVVDQLEETFTLCQDAGEREAFIENLIELAGQPGGGGSVVITLRSDFHGETYAYPRLAEALSEFGYLVPPLTKDDLRSIIEGPAAKHGRRLGPALVDLLIAQTAGRTGALPLLETALTRLWDAGSGNEEEALRAIGGVGGAVADAAERIFLELASDTDRAIARRAFLSIVLPGESGRATRRRATVASVTPHWEASRRVLDVLRRFAGGNARLLTLAAPLGRSAVEDIQLEITHEVLIARWDRLAGWLAERGDDLRLERRAAEKAEEWRAAGYPDGMLWRPPELTALESLQSRRGEDFTAPVQRFTNASRNAWAKEQRQRRAVRVSAAVTGAIILAIASVAFAAQSRAKNRLHDLYIEQGRQELLEGRYDRASVFLSAAYSGGSRVPALMYLLPIATRVIEAEIPVPDSVIRLRGTDGELFAQVQGSSLAVWDPRSQGTTTTLRDREACVVQSPDRSNLVEVSTSGAIRLHSDGHVIEYRLPSAVNGCPWVTGSHAAWSLWIATDDSLARWDVLRSGVRKHRAIPVPYGLTVVGVSSDGRYVAMDAQRYVPEMQDDSEVLYHDVVIFSTARGARLHTIPQAAFQGFSPDSKELLVTMHAAPSTGTNFVQARLRRITTGTWARRSLSEADAFHGPGGQFDCREALVVTHGEAGAAVWKEGSPIMQLDSQRSGEADLSSDCRYLAVGKPSTEEVEIWDVAAQALHTRIRDVGTDPVPRFLADGVTLAVTDADYEHSPAFWSLGSLLSNGRPLDSAAKLDSRFEDLFVSYSADERKLHVVQRWSGTVDEHRDSLQVSVWDARSRALEQVISPPRGARTLRSSRSGRRVAAWVGETLWLWTGNESLPRRFPVPSWNDRSDLEFGYNDSLYLAHLDGQVYVAHLGFNTPSVRGTSTKLSCVALSGDGSLRLARREGTNRLELSTAPEFSTPRVLPIEAECGWFFEGSNRFAVVSADSGKQWWDLGAANPERIPLAGEILAIDAAGERFHVARNDRSMIVHLAKRLTVELERNVSPVSSAFSGQDVLVTRDPEGSIAVWDLGSGRLLTVLPGSRGGLRFAVGLEGTQIAAASPSSGTQVWELRRENRAPAEIRRLLACRIPLQLLEGRIVARALDRESCSERPSP